MSQNKIFKFYCRPKKLKKKFKQDYKINFNLFSRF